MHETELISVRVTPADLALAVNALGILSRPAAPCSERLDCIERLCNDDAQKALVVAWRIDAMIAVLSSGALPPWATSDLANIATASSPLLAASATAKLLDSECGPRFDPADFKQTLLASALLCRLSITPF